MTLPSTPPGRKLLLVWSSADWASMNPHIDAGRMPHLAALIERGSIASLASTEPLTREALLTTLATGMLPDRHGVLAPVQRRADGGGVEPAGHRSWRAPAFWEHLEQDGLRTACIGWPATTPADRWPGIHVDETFALPSGAAFQDWPVPPHSVTPAALAPILAPLRVHPADPLFGALQAFVPALATIDQAADPRIGHLGEMLARTATLHAAATHIAEHEPWDLLCVTHELLHLAKLAFLGAAAPYARVLDQTHAFLDMMLGRLLDLAGPHATIVLVSPNALAAKPGAHPEAGPRGILVAAGPGIAADAMLPGARLVDIAPTILARFGLTLDCDGIPIEPLSPPGPRRSLNPPPAQPELRDSDPADALRALGYDDALTDAQTAALRKAEAIQAFNLGLALIVRGRLPDAAQALEAALARSPDDVQTLRRLARCRAMMGEYEACRPLAQRLLAIDPTLPWGHLVMATWCALGETTSDPEPYLVSARELGQDSAEVRIRIGGMELLRGNPAAAAADFEAALALDPGSAEAAYGIGISHAQCGDPAAAEAALRRAIQLEHNQPLAHLNLGTLLATQERLHDAATAFETALAQSPDLPGLAEALTQCRAALADGLVTAAIDKAG